MLFLFYFLFGEEPKACGILALPPGIKPTPPASESKVLTIGLPGKSVFTDLSIHMRSCVAKSLVVVV